MNFSKLFLIPALVVSSCSLHVPSPYLDGRLSEEQRVEDALQRMTLEEKVGVLHAQSRFSSRGVPRLGIPELWCSDGPHGIRAEVLWDSWKQAGWTNDSCTAYPALTALAATWNPRLSHLYGVSIGEEARYRKKNVLLGPGCNIYRTPLCGRNFEYMGEDPCLASKMVVPYIKGVQEQGVAACVKHYALNNQELHRHTTNVIVSERALNEIYLPAFKAAVVEGGVWAVMGSYNLYKDQHCCHNEYLTKILKEDWKFDGVLISDWGGTHDETQAVNNGLDLEFGTTTDGLGTAVDNAYDSFYLSQPYLARLKSGKESVEVLDEKVRRVLRLQMRTNLAPNQPQGRFSCPEHSAAARKIGGESIVLLKNEDNILPLRADKILVVGENATRIMTTKGGSSALKAKYEVTPLDGLRTAMENAEITYVQGYSSTEDLDFGEAVAAAESSDVVLFFGGLNKNRKQDAESDDRVSYELPYRQSELIAALAEVNKNIVVVNISGNAVAMPWAMDVKGIIQSWYLGSESGNCIADVLTGKVCPGGKLPYTIPVALEDGPVRTEAQYPGIPRSEEPDKKTVWDEEYSEDIFVGYRWYEKQSIKPLFAFGHGLSYTSFEISDIKASEKRVECIVRNVGPVSGSEVVQVYVSMPGKDRPLKELKAFEKVFLESGEKKRVVIRLKPEDFMQYDDSWILEKGEYTIHVGTSSDRIMESISLSLK